jgi:hypothetical protein
MVGHGALSPIIEKKTGRPASFAANEADAQAQPADALRVALFAAKLTWIITIADRRVQRVAASTVWRQG